MACIFSTAILDFSAGMTDSFEGRGLIRGGGGLIGGFTVYWKLYLFRLILSDDVVQVVVLLREEVTSFTQFRGEILHHLVIGWRILHHVDDVIEFFLVDFGLHFLPFGLDVLFIDLMKNDDDELQ